MIPLLLPLLGWEVDDLILSVGTVQQDLKREGSDWRILSACDAGERTYRVSFVGGTACFRRPWRTGGWLIDTEGGCECAVSVSDGDPPDAGEG